ncbi:MAG: GNAT family N-acetyltransferase [Rhodospirillaceae bacterium]
MSKPISVRPVERADFDAWSRLWAGYNDFYERRGPTAVSDDMTKLTWERFFGSDEPMYSLVAEFDGRIVGIANYLFHRNTVMVNPVCYLQDLFTDASMRGQGVGRALIEGVYERAREAGSSRLYWQTHETNKTAMRLYDAVALKSGFVVYRKDI